MQFTTTVLALAAAVAVSAQSNSSATSQYAGLTAAKYYTMIPTCVQSCTKYALARDYCPIDDFGCHCWQTSIVSALLDPCLVATANCTGADYKEFSQVVANMCAYENTTNAARWESEYGHGSAASSSNSSAKPSGTTASPAIFTGGAASLTAGAIGALGAVALVAGLVL